MKPTPAKPKIIIAHVEASGTAPAIGIASVCALPGFEKNSNAARELPEGVRSVTVMLSEPDVNPELAAILANIKVEVPPDLVVVLGKVPRVEFGPGVN